MKTLNKSFLLLLAGGLLLCSACGKSSDSGSVTLGDDVAPEEAAPAAPPAAAPQSETKPDGTCDIHITVHSVEVSEADLKANDYIVPLYIELDQNAGITYTEWGAYYDERCTLETDTYDSYVSFDTVCSINEEQHFFWTAWASSNGNQRLGNLILLKLKLPKTASAGDEFPVTYASYSLGRKPHVWENDEKSWVTDGVIGWDDGGVTVIK